MRGLIFACLAVITGISLWSCDFDDQNKQDLKRFIPGETQKVAKITDPEQLAVDLGRNELARALRQEPAIRGFIENQALISRVHPVPYLYLFSNRGSGSELQLVTRNDTAVFRTDSIEGLEMSKLEETGLLARRLILDSDTLYSSVIDSVLLLSSGVSGVKKLAAQAELALEHSDWDDALGHHSSKNLVLYEQQPRFALRDSSSISFADHSMLEMEITTSQLSIRGFAKSRDSTINFINLFRGQQPQPTILFDILPVDALNASSFTFRDPGQLIKNLNDLKRDSTAAEHPLLFDTLLEIGQIELPGGQALFTQSLDPSLTEEQLEPYLNEATNFRDVPLYNFVKPDLFRQWFSPLIAYSKAAVSFRLGDHFFFCDQVTTAEKLITSFQNNAVMVKSPLYKNNSEEVLGRINAQYIYTGDQVSRGLYQVLGYPLEEAPVSKVGDYSLGVLQTVNEKDFAHINFTARESSGSKQLSAGLSQLATIKLEVPIMSEVQLFTNHRTSGKDIVFQDINNDLSLYSSSGKRLWKKRLEAPILGRIKEVDILRNGKKQLAFTTSSKLHVIDRNGNNVAPFPVNFKDPVTQPLAVFDYDNNRKYRFAVVQGKEILLYDSRAKVVTGFRFRRTGSPIVLPPKHIRIGNKDYVVIAEGNGRLNILSRVGRVRVEVDKRFEFSKNPVAREGDNFVVITADNKKATISPAGKISVRDIDVGSDFFFEILRRNKVTLDENLLRINGKLIELPFGIYSEPVLFRSGNRVLVGLTETQEKKVYVFDNSGELLPGLPAFGSSAPDYGRSRNLGNLIVVKGGDQQILLYKLGS